MGGFIKGIVVGLVSFALGFAVLSVVIPVVPETTSARDAEHGESVQSEAESAVIRDQRVVPANGPAAATEAASDVDTPPTEPLAIAEPAVMENPQTDPSEPTETTLLPRAMPDRVARQEGSGVDQVAPQDTQIAEENAPQSEEQDAFSTSGHDADPRDVDPVALATESAPDAVVDNSAIASTAPALPVQDDLTEASEDPVGAVASGAPADGAASAVAQDAALEALIPETLAEVPESPAPEAVSPDLAATTAEAAPAAPIQPVPATNPPELPLLDLTPDAVAPQDLPRVEAMPSGAPGVSVRRGGASTDAPQSTGITRAVEGVTVGRLPSIGADPQATPEAAQAPEDDQPAYRRNAAFPEHAPETWPMGVVLTESPAAEAALLALPFQVTIAMDPYDPDGPRRAVAYRAAGHDIALLAMGVPARATSQDLETILQVWFQAYPGIVALMDVPQGAIGRQRALADELATMLAADGYGMIALRDGLDGFVQAARQSGVASASIFRMLDDRGQGAVTISRLLDRAAFEAERSSGILVAGSAANPDTIAALTQFADGFGRRGVSLVPASAMLSP